MPEGASLYLGSIIERLHPRTLLFAAWRGDGQKGKFSLWLLEPSERSSYDNKRYALTKNPDTRRH